jgi:osmotically inducible protein OsmC
MSNEQETALEEREHMPIAQRTAEVTWTGSLILGQGALSAGSGSFDGLPVSWAGRTVRADRATSPEELVAAAHATCFTMALALVLAKTGSPPERIATRAECVLDEVQGAPRITRSVLRVNAQVDGMDPAAFGAAEICPVSNALRGNIEISINAVLRKGA